MQDHALTMVSKSKGCKGTGGAGTQNMNFRKVEPFRSLASHPKPVRGDQPRPSSRVRITAQANSVASRK